MMEEVEDEYQDDTEPYKQWTNNLKWFHVSNNNHNEFGGTNHEQWTHFVHFEFTLRIFYKRSSKDTFPDLI